jgi:hypothetical protein
MDCRAFPEFKVNPAFPAKLAVLEYRASRA